MHSVGPFTNLTKSHHVSCTVRSHSFRRTSRTVTGTATAPVASKRVQEPKFGCALSQNPSISTTSPFRKPLFSPAQLVETPKVGRSECSPWKCARAKCHRLRRQTVWVSPGWNCTRVCLRTGEEVERKGPRKFVFNERIDACLEKLYWGGVRLFCALFANHT